MAIMVQMTAGAMEEVIQEGVDEEIQEDDVEEAGGAASTAAGAARSLTWES